MPVTNYKNEDNRFDYAKIADVSVAQEQAASTTPSFRKSASRLVSLVETCSMVEKQGFDHLYFHLIKGYDTQLHQLPWENELPNANRVIYGTMAIYANTAKRHITGFQIVDENETYMMVTLKGEHPKTHKGDKTKGFEIIHTKRDIIKVIPQSATGAVLIEDFYERIRSFKQRIENPIEITLPTKKPRFRRF